jgi:hypothetical protein
MTNPENERQIMNFKLIATNVHGRIVARTETREEAESLASIFPKSLRAGFGRCSVPGEADYGYVEVGADLRSNGRHGSVNEAGIKRLQRFTAILVGAGHSLSYEAHVYSNSMSVEEAAELVGVEGFAS